MKILFVVGNYLPHKNGGIENYTHWLANILLKNDFEVEVAAINPGECESYIYEAIKVNNIKAGLAAFEILLRTGSFDICHFHEYSEDGGIEIPWFKKAREYCTKVFFTFHLPYLTCYKLDFRFKGLEDCNTFTNLNRCTECVIADKIGYKKIGGSNLYLYSWVTLMRVSGKKSDLEKRIISKYQILDELIQVCDYLFIYADWFKNILVTNGYTDPHIKKIPYKTKTTTTEIGNSQDNAIKNKLLFVGRIQYQKGLHLLCKAMNNIDITNITLEVYGNIVDQDYYDHCKKSYQFNYKGTTNHLQLLSIFKEYDFLVLPSVFTEMYSLVIKDAFYENLPVIASSAKGNVDAIVDGRDGFLFEYDNAADLALKIDKAYRLKKQGWGPIFKYSEDPEGDTKEIISYYSCD